MGIDTVNLPQGFPMAPPVGGFAPPNFVPQQQQFAPGLPAHLGIPAEVSGDALAAQYGYPVQQQPMQAPQLPQLQAPQPAEQFQQPQMAQQFQQPMPPLPMGLPLAPQPVPQPEQPVVLPQTEQPTTPDESAPKKRGRKKSEPVASPESISVPLPGALEVAQQNNSLPSKRAITVTLKIDIDDLMSVLAYEIQ